MASFVTPQCFVRSKLHIEPKSIMFVLEDDPIIVRLLMQTEETPPPQLSILQSERKK